MNIRSRTPQKETRQKHNKPILKVTNAVTEKRLGRVKQHTERLTVNPIRKAQIPRARLCDPKRPFVRSQML